MSGSSRTCAGSGCTSATSLRPRTAATTRKTSPRCRRSTRRRARRRTSTASTTSPDFPLWFAHGLDGETDMGGMYDLLTGGPPGIPPVSGDVAWVCPTEWRAGMAITSRLHGAARGGRDASRSTCGGWPARCSTRRPATCACTGRSSRPRTRGRRPARRPRDRRGDRAGPARCRVHVATVGPVRRARRDGNVWRRPAHRAARPSAARRALRSLTNAAGVIGTENTKTSGRLSPSGTRVVFTCSVTSGRGMTARSRSSTWTAAASSPSTPSPGDHGAGMTYPFQWDGDSNSSCASRASSQGFDGEIVAIVLTPGRSRTPVSGSSLVGYGAFQSDGTRIARRSRPVNAEGGSTPLSGRAT